MLTPELVVPTTCPYCGVGCQIDLRVRGGAIYRVDGRRDNAVNRGNLCVKGRFGYDFVHAPDRLTTPLMQDSGSFVPVSWNAALDEVAGQLRRVRDQHGPDSVAFFTSAKCTNEENYLLQKFTRAGLTTNNIDHCARL